MQAGTAQSLQLILQSLLGMPKEPGSQADKYQMHVLLTLAQRWAAEALSQQQVRGEGCLHAQQQQHRMAAPTHSASRSARVAAHGQLSAA